IPSLDDAIDYRTTREDAKRIGTQSMWDRLSSPSGRAKSPSHILAIPVDGFRSWERDAPREDGGAPGAFDAVAAGYALRKGLPLRGLLEVMRTKIEAATWMVRAYTPLQKEEFFVEVDPRAARVI